MLLLDTLTFVHVGLPAAQATSTVVISGGLLTRGALPLEGVALPLLQGALTLVGFGIALVRDAVPLVGFGVPLVGFGVAYVGDAVPLVGFGIALVRDAVPLVGMVTVNHVDGMVPAIPSSRSSITGGIGSFLSGLNAEEGSFRSLQGIRRTAKTGIPTRQARLHPRVRVVPVSETVR